MECINEDEDDLLFDSVSATTIAREENVGEDIDMDGDDDFVSVVNNRETASVATSVLLDASPTAADRNLAAARGNETALAVTPQASVKSVPAASYPAVLTDDEIRKLRSNRSVCSGITAAGNRIVSHIPTNAPTKSSSAASYDGRLQRDNVKRMARYQG